MHEEDKIESEIGTYVPAGQKTHDDDEVEKYKPAAQGAKAVMMINPLPPFPALDPPTPTPATYPFVVFMLYVRA